MTRASTAVCAAQAARAAPIGWAARVVMAALPVMAVLPAAGCGHRPSAAPATPAVPAQPTPEPAAAAPAAGPPRVFFGAAPQRVGAGPQRVGAGPQRAPAAAKADLVPFGPDERVEELTFLRDAIRDSYAHLETKRAQWGVDLDGLYAAATPAVRAAASWRDHESVMVAFTSAFHDAHLDWRRRRGPGEARRRVVRLGLRTRFAAGGELVVTGVWPGSAAARAGFVVGDQILGIDGQPVASRFAAWASLRSWSRDEAGRYDFAEEWPARHVPEAAAPPERLLVVQHGEAPPVTLAVAPEVAPDPGGRPPPIELVDRAGVPVLRVRTLDAPEAELAGALDALAPRLGAAAGLVVDLRGNPGGSDETARLVASRLVTSPVVGGVVRVRLSARARAAHPAWARLPEDPAHPGWSLPQPVRAEPSSPARAPRPTAVVVDAGCRSSCEALALLLRAAGARVVGERTGGSSGAPLTLTLPRSGARVRIPAWAMFDDRGAAVEGEGVAPDDEVAPTRADVAAGRDRALAVAAAWAAARAPAPAATAPATPPPGRAAR